MWDIDQTTFDAACTAATPSEYIDGLLLAVGDHGYIGLNDTQIHKMENIAWSQDDEIAIGEGVAILAAFPQTQPPRRRPIVG